jgi:hypothetical protein
MQLRRYPAVFFFLVIALVAISGCGRLGTITGKVTHQGQPVTYGIVIFYYADGTRNDARIANDGTYTMINVKPGPVRIGVESPKPSMGPGKAGIGGERDPAKWFPIDKKYANPDTSGKEATIKGSDTLNIELE